MTLLSFISTSLPLRLEQRKEESVKDGERERKRRSLKVQIRYKVDSLILRWGINEASAGYDSTVSDGEELCGPLGSGSH